MSPNDITKDGVPPEEFSELGHEGLEAAPSSTPTAAPANEATRLAWRSPAKMVETGFVIRSRSRGWSLTRRQLDPLPPGYQRLALTK
jgi:hypothetical protein